MEERILNNNYTLIEVNPIHESNQYGIKVTATLEDGTEQPFFISNRIANKLLNAEKPVKVNVETRIVKLRTTGTYCKHIIKEVMT